MLYRHVYVFADLRLICNGFNEFVEGESPFGGHFDEILTVNGLERIFLAGYGPEQDQYDGEDAFHGPAIYG